MDFQVSITQGFLDRATTWEWRQFSLTCDTLEILDGQKKRVAGYPLNECSFDRVSGHYYQLKRKSRAVWLISCPSPTRFARFLIVLKAAKCSNDWSVPKEDLWTQLIHVASAIVEIESAEPSRNALTSRMSIATVQEYLTEMKRMYDIQNASKSVEDFYERLLDKEAAYVNDPNVQNFAHTTHRLYPIDYMKPKREEKPVSLKAILRRCPRKECRGELEISHMFAIHIKQASVMCPQCRKPVNYKLIQLSKLLQTIDTIQVKCMLDDNPVTLKIAMPPLPNDGSLSTYKGALNAACRVEGTRGSIEGAKELRRKTNQTLEQHLRQCLGHFEIDLVQAMFRQLDLISKICTNYEYWSHPRVIMASIIRYHKFMRLMVVKSPNDPVLVPTCDIDLVWNTHQTYPHNYREYCIQLTNYVIDHNYNIAGGDLKEGYATTFALWSAEFDEPYSSFPPLSTISKSILPWPSTNRRSQKLFRLPSYDCRFVGVDEWVLGRPSASRLIQPNDEDIFVAVIGTPVMDGRVRLKRSKHTLVLEDGTLDSIQSFFC